MKIVHLYKDYYPVLGGIENHVKVVAERQAADGHEVSVLVTSPTAHSTEEVRNGVRVLKAARLATLASTPLSLSYPLTFRRQSPDLVHLHFPYPLAELSYLLRGSSPPAVLSYHSDVVKQQTILRVYRPLMLGALAKVGRILVASPNYRASSDILQRFPEKCSIVPYGMDYARFSSASADAVAELRDSLGSGPLLLFVGVLRYYKGLDYMIRAMTQIEGRLVIVGAGPMEKTWRELAVALGLADRVVFAGRVSDADLPTYYRACDLFVLPASARSEAFGLVQLEAMASGLPIISTELGTGTSFVNEHMTSGLVVAPRDAEALAGAANRLLQDASLRSELGQGALLRSRLFSVERMMEGIYEAYARSLA